MKLFRWLPLAALFPMAARANIQLDYYTYNAFDETVDAFKRVALMMNNSSFTLFAGLICVLGLVIGIVSVAAKNLGGQNSHPIGWMLPIVVGAAIFKGLCVPHGTIHVYDPVRNAYQAVGDVPDIVVLVAGGLNKIERWAREVVDTSTADPSSDISGGVIDYSLLLNASTVQIDNSAGLSKSLVRYYQDCGTFAISTNYKGVSEQEFRHESNDLGATFAKFNNPAISTVYYTDGNDGGTTMSCFDAWSSVSAPLYDVNTYTTAVGVICQKAGYNMADAAQATQCTSELSNTTAMFNGAPANYVALLRSRLLAQATSDALNQDDFGSGESMLANRQMMAQAEGTSQALSEWVPRLRGAITAWSIGVVPFILLFIATPLAWRVAALMVGMFVFVSLWGVMDAMAVVMQNDAAAAAMSEVARYHLGYEAIMNSPTAAVQALGVFGKARMLGLTVATVLSGALFGLSGLGALALKGIGESSKAGSDAGETENEAERRGALQQQLLSAGSADSAIAVSGFGGAALAENARAMNQANQTQQYVSRMIASGSGMNGAILAASTYSAGSDAGFFGAMTHNERSGGPTVGDVGEIGGLARAGNVTGDALGSAAAGNVVGKSVFELSKDIARDSMYMNRVETAAMFQELVSDHSLQYAAEMAGFIKAGDQESAMQQYRSLNGTDVLTHEGIENYWNLKNGSMLASANVFSGAEGGHQYQRVAATELQRRRGSADEIGGRANAVGHSEGDRATVSAEAWSEAKHLEPRRNLIKAEVKNLVAGAESAGAMVEAGGIKPVSRATARADVAKHLGGARMLESAAIAIGLDPMVIGNLIETAAVEQGVPQFSLYGPQLNTVLDKLEHDNLITKEAADHAREQGFATVTSTLDQYGNIGSVRLFTGSDVHVSDKTTIEAGTSRTQSDTNTFNLSQDFAGGVGLLKHENLVSELSSIYDNGDIFTGKLDERRLDALASGLAQAVRQQGFGETASSAHDRNRSWNISANANAGAGLGKRFAGPSASAGLGTSGNYTQSHTSSARTSEDRAITAMREVILHALDSTRDEYVKRYGQEHAFGPLHHEINNGLLEEAATRVQRGEHAFVTGTQNETADAKEVSDKFGGAGGQSFQKWPETGIRNPLQIPEGLQ